MNQKNTQQKGFTLIELMVSIAIFTIVVVAVIGSVYTANASARKAQATETVLNNVNFALESMVRTIRTGTIISCSDPIVNSGLQSGDCQTENPSDPTYIVVHNTLGTESYMYYFYDASTKSIQKETWAVVNGVLSSDGWSDPVAITAPSVSVQKMQFNFIGLNTPNQQRGVSVLISGYATTDTDKTPFTIQTFVSQRNF